MVDFNLPVKILWAEVHHSFIMSEFGTLIDYYLIERSQL